MPDSQPAETLFDELYQRLRRLASSHLRRNEPITTGLAVDSAGNVYVAELLGQSIRKVTPAGVVSTFAH